VVEIRSIAREPGERAKVAVAATQQGIDPVGACVGIRGVRIQAIVRELHEEKIDVIEWNADPALYIAKAISPARVTGVYLNDHTANGKTATVVVPEDQLSLAIGRDGQNARLAAKLTGWRIDIKSLPEAASDTLNKVRTDPAMAATAEAETERIAQVDALLLKKSEGRALTPEEYDHLNQFVDRIERRSATKRQAEKKAEDQRMQEARATIPDRLFVLSLFDSGLPEHVSTILSEAGFTSLGDLMMRMKLDPDSVLALQGIGPKAMQEIDRVMVEQTTVAPVVEVPPVEAIEVSEVETPAAEPEVAPVAEPAIEETVEEQPAVEAKVEAEVEPVAEETAPATEGVLTEEEEPTSLDELFALKPEVLEVAAVEEETDEEGDAKKGKKKGKKKKHVEVEFDPDRGMMVVRKKHKRSGGEWGNWE
jgi:N utilization substance protein A